MSIALFSRSDADQYLCLSEGISPALIFDPNKVRSTWNALQNALPGVSLFYAVKSNPYPSLLKTLVFEGASFDAASTPEVQTLLGFGVPVNKIIHTHPIKMISDLEQSVALGIETFVVDNLDELWKLAPYRNDLKVMLRLAFVAPDAPIDLSRKFGAMPEDALSILDIASQMGITIDGLCFHVGSQAQTAATHKEALLECLNIAKNAAEKGIADIRRIDIGGGFPADYANCEIDFVAFCEPIREALKSVPNHIEVMAEPGRAISAPSMTLVSKVIGRSKRQEGVWWYYLDDGVYGAQSGRIYDHIDYSLEIYTDGGNPQKAIFAGPTCDSVDRFGDTESLPELSIGDVVVIKNIGAYSLATSCHFNGIAPPEVIELPDDIIEIQQMA